MQILSAAQVRAWDEYTIQKEPVLSADLMERAATRCYEWLQQNGYTHQSFSIYCGKGNNGGDGLVIARLLWENGQQVAVHILEFGHKGTDDFQLNLARLHDTGVPVSFVQTEAHLHTIPAEDVIIDALFGSGLNRPLEGLTARLVTQLNESGNEIIAIDLPSGLRSDDSSKGYTIIQATNTLTFQCYKPAFLVAENEPFTGQVAVLDIGLHPDYQPLPDYRLISPNVLQQFFKPRRAFSHKGSFGHALLIAGSRGKTGAAVLAAKACLHSGVGLLSVHIPAQGYTILQTAVPEAMTIPDPLPEYNSSLPDELSRYAAIGIGPGLGTHDKTAGLLYQLINSYQQPLVLDADALNILSTHPDWYNAVPAGSLLTPHPKEFERLFGKSANDFERINLARQAATTHQWVIVLKGHRTLIATPSGDTWFNQTGNAGMATGGTGDVLTGILTGLVAQGYTTTEAALLGVYLHGLAGDLALQTASMESMIASDLVNYLGQAFYKLID